MLVSTRSSLLLALKWDAQNADPAHPLSSPRRSVCEHPDTFTFAQSLMSLLEPLCFPGSALISRTICPLLPHTRALQTRFLPKSLASFFLSASVCLFPSLSLFFLKP